MKRYQLRMGGRGFDPQGAAWFETQNPYTGEAWGQIPRCDARDVDVAVQAAHRALTSGPWAGMAPTQRGAVMRRLGGLIARAAANLAAAVVDDNGKRLGQIEGQV